MASAARTILVVEDNFDLRRLVAISLRQKGFVVLEAENPYQAADIVGSDLFNIDLLVADVEMPNMSGDEFAAELRGMKPTLRIIFATGVLPEEGRGFSAIAHDAYLPKPYSPQDVLNAVESALRAP
jgi:two-component system cell cycle sensor histidine kinase/response regulator CckA